MTTDTDATIRDFLTTLNPTTTPTAEQEIRAAVAHDARIRDSLLAGYGVCALCGTLLVGPENLCSHHLKDGDDWARGNRIYCEFFHRKRLVGTPMCALPLGGDGEVSGDV